MTPNRIKIFAVLFVLVVGSVASLYAFTGKGESQRTKPQVAVGTPVGAALALSDAELSFLSQVQEGSRRGEFSREVYTLGVHGSRVIYRADLSNGGACYIAGSPLQVYTFGRFGAIVCSNRFPSDEALLDLSVVQVVKDGDQKPHFVEVMGVASSGVRRVQAVSATGDVVAEVPVVNSVYALDLPAAGSADRIIALNADGAEIARVPR